MESGENYWNILICGWSCFGDIFFYPMNIEKIWLNTTEKL